MQSHSVSQVRPDPNVTPMIDVMLVLLVIFMIIIPAMVTGTHAIAPEGNNLTPHPEEAADRVLAVDRDGRFYLNKRAISADSLASALSSAINGRPDDRVLYVTADKGLAYAVVENTLTLAGQAGFRVVGLVSEKRQPKPNVGSR
jgi:biopolymer transport protein ExbD